MLPGYLARQQAGALEIACSLVASGQTALLDVTVKAALKALRSGNTSTNDVASACPLVVRNGNEEQFDEYLRIMKEAKAQNTARYGQMCQVAWEDKSPP